MASPHEQMATATPRARPSALVAMSLRRYADRHRPGAGDRRRCRLQLARSEYEEQAGARRWAVGAALLGRRGNLPGQRRSRVELRAGSFTQQLIPLKLVAESSPDRASAQEKGGAGTRSVHRDGI